MYSQLNLQIETMKIAGGATVQVLPNDLFTPATISVQIMRVLWATITLIHRLLLPLSLGRGVSKIWVSLEMNEEWGQGELLSWPFLWLLLEINLYSSFVGVGARQTGLVPVGLRESHPCVARWEAGCCSASAREVKGMAPKQAPGAMGNAACKHQESC